ncbi:hypothetical protein A5666_27105 [Mycolicibacterium fortuitum]|uniref:hypothetical protein n=1 Tax=Mycolicibacterium fortuitum TaxID=1766 RepID=UPI0007EB7B8C|nr:hypothetical protein [Mycolicibacterium fortuitum]OBA96995.1 hypothetical protein A5665_28230 [Mycolicibacterium fortuitum]OBI68729.1 hypothetical protein A5666_27105 [Mycolicibacterium fortuitum]
MSAVSHRLAEVDLSELVTIWAIGDGLAAGLADGAGAVVPPCLPCVVAAAMVTAGAAVLAGACGVFRAEGGRRGFGRGP